MLSCFLSLPQCKRHLAMQGRLGAVSSKPTNFHSANSQPFEDTVKRLSAELATGQLASLVGKGLGGSFKTAAAKEYQTTLCKAIAEAACISICEAAGGNVVKEVLLDQLQGFFVASDGYGTCGFGAEHWVVDSFDGGAVLTTSGIESRLLRPRWSDGRHPRNTRHGVG